MVRTFQSTLSYSSTNTLTASRDNAPPAGSRGSWFGGVGGWFSKKESKDLGSGAPGGPIRAKLGEESSFVFDKETNRWVNKKKGAVQTPVSAGTPPPPRGSAPPSRTPSGIPGAAMAGGQTSGAPGAAMMGPPSRTASNGPPATPAAVVPHAGPVAALAGSSGPPSRPPSRPSTGMSAGSDIDDLLGPAAPRRAGGTKKGAARKGRYVDVMAAKGT